MSNNGAFYFNFAIVPMVTTLHSREKTINEKFIHEFRLNIYISVGSSAIVITRKMHSFKRPPTLEFRRRIVPFMPHARLGHSILPQNTPFEKCLRQVRSPVSPPARVGFMFLTGWI
jgi:hypothetical protein